MPDDKKNANVTDGESKGGRRKTGFLFGDEDAFFLLPLLGLAGGSDLDDYSKTYNHSLHHKRLLACCRTYHWGLRHDVETAEEARYDQSEVLYSKSWASLAFLC